MVHFFQFSSHQEVYKVLSKYHFWLRMYRYTFLKSRLTRFYVISCDLLWLHSWFRTKQFNNFFTIEWPLEVTTFHQSTTFKILIPIKDIRAIIIFNHIDNPFFSRRQWISNNKNKLNCNFIDFFRFWTNLIFNVSILKNWGKSNFNSSEIPWLRNYNCGDNCTTAWIMHRQFRSHNNRA